MKAPDVPPDEAERLAALRALEILETPREERFDRITRTLARVLRVPTALVSLVDADRVWFKSRTGAGATEAPRRLTFCGHAILDGGTFAIDDARDDPRFFDNPIVTDPPHVRAYAGQPLRSRGGHRVGTLCVIDTEPRRWTAAELATLVDLAGWVETELATISDAHAREVIAGYEQFFSLSVDLLCIVGFDGRARLLSPSWSAAMGYGVDELRARFGALLHPDDAEEAQRQAASLAAGGRSMFECRMQRADGSWRTLEWSAAAILEKELIYAVVRDVTEARRVVSALAESEARYRDLVDSANDLIQSVDAQGRFLFVNRAWRETLGYDADEVERLTLFDVLAPASREKCLRIFDELRAGTPVGSIEAELLTRDGRGVTVEGRINTQFDAGRMVSTRGIFRNVTRRRRVEAALAHSHEMLQTISAAQSEFIASHDSREVFEHLLSELLRLTRSEYGLIAEVLRRDVGAPYLEPHAMRSLAWDEPARAYYAETMPAGLELPSPSTLLGAVIESRAAVVSNDPEHDPRPGGLPHGHPPLGSFLGLPVHEGGLLTGLVVIANRPGGYDRGTIDSLAPFLATCASLVEAARSDRRRRSSEQAVADSEARLRAIVDTSIDGLVTIDERGRIETFNPAAERLFGCTADQIIGRNVSVLMPSPQRELHDHYMAEYRRTGHQKVIGIGREVVAMRMDGTSFPANLAVSEIQLGERRIFTGRIHDLTERKRIEQMKSEFVSTVSHELRTPLTSIRGSLGLLSGSIAGELPPKARAMVDIALKNAERLGMLINDILDIEKIESGQMRFAPRLVDIGPLAAQAVESHQGFAAPLGVRIVLDDRASPALALLDPDRLLQVLANLISNAAKFAPPGTEVFVRVLRAEDRLRIEVEDRGPGIPTEFHSRVFERFAQADGSNNRRRGGTGLGLSITKTIVERSGGEVGFDTAVGRGTTFWVSLPESSPSLARPASGAPPGARVLVCDGDPGAAAELSMTLQQDGIECDVARTAREARAMIERRAYAALTLDLHVPDLEGFTPARDLREREIETPVVIVSGHAGSDELDARLRGVIDWLTERPVPEHDRVVLDSALPDGEGLALLPLFGAKSIPVVVFSAAESTLEPRSPEAALVKPRVTNEALRETILRALGRPVPGS